MKFSAIFLVALSTFAAVQADEAAYAKCVVRRTISAHLPPAPIRGLPSAVYTSNIYTSSLSSPPPPASRLPTLPLPFHALTPSFPATPPAPRVRPSQVYIMGESPPTTGQAMCDYSAASAHCGKSSGSASGKSNCDIMVLAATSAGLDKCETDCSGAFSIKTGILATTALALLTSVVGLSL